jgi:4-amino-4-deoxy-L-arabinose transferase-like glycosyltransferase
VTTAPEIRKGGRTNAAAQAAVDRVLDRHAWLVFAAFASVCLVSLLVRARAKPFWHDEIYTILHAGLPTFGTMWRAGVDGFDLSPPLNTWLTRAVHAVVGVGHVSTRVPPMLGYMTMTVVVFSLLRSRANTVTALSGALLPCFTAAYRYSYEARGYGLMVGLFAVALYAWSQAARDRNRAFHVAVLAATLAGSVWNHYYGVLVFVPIAVGEGVRSLQRRRIDVGILGAFFAAALAIVPIYPLAAAARTQSESFWSRASMADVGTTYQFVFAPLVERDVAYVAIAVGALAFFARASKSDRRLARGVPLYEFTAGLVALLIPVLGVALGVVLTGVFVPRYAISAVLAPSLVVPLIVWQRHTRGGVAELLLCGFLLFAFARSMGPSLLSRPVFVDPYLSKPLLQSAVTTGAGVISSSSLQFLQLWYYTPNSLKGRIRYLADVENARRFMASDTIDRGYLALHRWTTVPIEPYESFVAGHREFRVHEAGSGWLLRKLDEIGASKMDLGRGPGERLLLVQLPGEPPNR